MSYIPEPVTRIDKYLAYIAGNMDVVLPDHPITRKEHYLAAWAEKSGFEDVDVAGEPPLTLENAIGKPLKGLRIYGKSKQKTTTGAQLLDQTKATVDGWNIKYDIPLEKSKTYTFTNGEKAANSVRLFGVNPGEKDELLSNEYLPPKVSYTFTCAKDYATILLSGADGKTVFDGRYMLNTGSAPLPWEPYTGGKPSPNPDYPQEIESVGQDMNNIMLSISSTALPHEPQSMFIATPNGLPGIPVSYGGNYTDADGQRWICDEIDFAKGVYVQRIAKKLLTSTGKYKLTDTAISNKKRILIKDISANTVLPSKTADTIGAVMVDFLFAKSANETYLCKEGISIEITGYIMFYVESIQTVEQAQEYFKDNPMTLYYALATPIETPLTDEQLAIYKALHTYKGTTIIDNDDGAYMSVRYEKMK